MDKLEKQQEAIFVKHSPSNGVLSMTFWFGLLCFVSVGMTVGNKFVMLHYRYPNVVTLLQNATGVTIAVSNTYARLLHLKLR